MNKKLIIFDLDGTLLDTIGDLATSANMALRQYSFPTHEIEDYKLMVGNGARKLIERALPKEFAKPDVIEQLKKTFVEYYIECNSVLTRPYEGVEELLGELKNSGLYLAVASNKIEEVAKKLVNSYFGKGFFDIVLGQIDTRAVKPDAAILKEILTTLDVDANETLYVGDSGVDMQTAINSGIESVGVSWGFRPAQELLENGADHIAHRPCEIKAWI